ncbi:MAG: PEPxxWA-CTERM sorting domain-containing protein [Sphingomicrobium sp.]
MLSSLTTPALAQLTFENVPNTIYDAPIARDGYSIGNIAGDELHFHEIDSTAFSGFVVSNGTGVLYNDRDTSIFIESLVSGGTFALGAFDGSAVAGGVGTGATSLFVQGFLLGNLVNSGNFTINGGGFTNFSGLAGTFDRLTFDGINGEGGFQLDNINLRAVEGAVPEPSTWAMMLIGFGAVGYSMRRRRRSGGTAQIA